MASIHMEPFIRKNSFRDEVLGDHLLGFSFSMMPAGIRGDYLSCLEDFKLCVDGEEVGLAHVTITVSGRTYPAAEMPALAEVFWPFDEDAVVTVYNGRSAAELKEVSVSFALRMPFVGDWEHHLAVPKRDKIVF